MMELFSRQFFKEHMFEAVVDLASDPVPNIRLRVCPLLPKLKVKYQLISCHYFDALLLQSFCSQSL